MIDYKTYHSYERERREKYMNDFQKRVINRIDAWAKTRPYPCSVNVQHTFSPNSVTAEPEIERTSLSFSPCGYVEIGWDGCRYVSMTVDTIIQHISEEHSKYFGRAQQNRDRAVPEIEKVIFNDPATIIFWKDGTKTVVKCGENDEFNPEVGMAMAISKKALGNKGNYCNEFKKWLQPYWAEPDFAVSLSDAFRNAADNISRLAEALGLTTEKSMHHGCTDCKYGRESLAYPVCRDCTVTRDDNDDHVFSNWEPKEDVSE